MNTSFPSSKKKYVTPSTEMFVVWEEFNILAGSNVEGEGGNTYPDEGEEFGNGAKFTTTRSYFFDDYRIREEEEDNAIYE